MLDKTSQAEKLFDFNSMLPVKPLSYPCRISEFGECEADCRRVVGRELKNDEILASKNGLVPNYNLFEGAVHANSGRLSGEYACSRYGRAIRKPGLDVFAKISTDPARFDTVGKYLPLGRLCCRKQCHCELYWQEALYVSQDSLEKGSLLQNLTAAVSARARHTSYDCHDEISDCLAECRAALAEYLQSDFLMRNETLKPLVTSNVDVLAEGTPGSRVCSQLARNISDPGINLYLRYFTDERKFPFIEEVHVGRICCLPFSGAQFVFVPFNRCFKYNDGFLPRKLKSNMANKNFIDFLASPFDYFYSLIF